MQFKNNHRIKQFWDGSRERQRDGEVGFEFESFSFLIHPSVEMCGKEVVTELQPLKDLILWFISAGQVSGMRGSVCQWGWWH